MEEVKEKLQKNFKSQITLDYGQSLNASTNNGQSQSSQLPQNNQTAKELPNDLSEEQFFMELSMDERSLFMLRKIVSIEMKVNNRQKNVKRNNWNWQRNSKHNNRKKYKNYQNAHRNNYLQIGL